MRHYNRVGMRWLWKRRLLSAAIVVASMLAVWSGIKASILLRRPLFHDLASREVLGIVVWHQNRVINDDFGNSGWVDLGRNVLVVVVDCGLENSGRSVAATASSAVLMKGTAWETHIASPKNELIIRMPDGSLRHFALPLRVVRNWYYQDGLVTLDKQRGANILEKLEVLYTGPDRSQLLESIRVAKEQSNEVP